MAQGSNTVERVMARLGARAHGTATREELLAAHVSSDQIQARIENGSLIPRYPGTYRVGHAAHATRRA